MTIREVVKVLNNSPKIGLQITKHKGTLKSTWVIYMRAKHYYYFDVSEKFIFDKQHRYNENELFNEFKNGIYTIDEEIL